MRLRHALTGAVLLALAGCHDPVTEIVLVVGSDLSAPLEVNELTLEIDTSTGVTRESFALGARGTATFPATIGLLPGDTAGFGPFDLIVSVIDGHSASPTFALVQRKISGVRFVRGAVRMLYVELSRACACQGTSCPHASDAACIDVTSPTLSPFDPHHLPVVPPSDGGTDGGGTDGGVGGAGGGGGTGGATLDAAPVEHPVEAGRDVASSDGAIDRPRDAPLEKPAPLPQGHACVAGDVCETGFCVDGYCCQGACKCGSCSMSPGFCFLATAGTDPRGECGAYTCNGGGACETSCPETLTDCSTRCSPSGRCNGAGQCVPRTTGAGYFCVPGECNCMKGLTCDAPDAGGVGTCK